MPPFAVTYAKQQRAASGERPSSAARKPVSRPASATSVRSATAMRPASAASRTAGASPQLQRPPLSTSVSQPAPSPAQRPSSALSRRSTGDDHHAPAPTYSVWAPPKHVLGVMGAHNVAATQVAGKRSGWFRANERLATSGRIGAPLWRAKEHDVSGLEVDTTFTASRGLSRPASATRSLDGSSHTRSRPQSALRGHPATSLRRGAARTATPDRSFMSLSASTIRPGSPRAGSHRSRQRGDSPHSDDDEAARDAVTQLNSWEPKLTEVQAIAEHVSGKYRTSRHCVGSYTIWDLVWERKIDCDERTRAEMNRFVEEPALPQAHLPTQRTDDLARRFQ